MDAIARKTKEAELQTWQQNLAVHQAQAALHGMTPPVDLVNEIETAKRNIKRIQAELDAGQVQSLEATQTGILELVMVLERKVTAQDKRLESMETQVSRLYKRATPGIMARLSRIAAVMIVFALYTAAVIKEVRDAVLTNLWPSVIIVVLSLLLAGLFFAFANLLQPVEVRDDDG